MKSFRILFFALFISYFPTVFGQNLDSLYTEIAKKTQDTNQVFTLLQIGKVHESNNYDSASFYYGKALQLSQEIKSQKWISEAQYELGNLYMRQGKYDLSIEFMKKSLAIDKQLQNFKGIAGAHSSIGVCYMYMGQYESATKHLERCLFVSDSAGLKTIPGMAYQNLGLVYINMGNYDKADQFLDSSIAYNKKRNAIGRLGNAYNDKGIVAYNRRQYNEALKWYKKSLQYHLDAGVKWGAANNYLNIGIVNVFQALADTNTTEEKVHFYSLAIKNMKRSASMKVELDDIGGVAQNKVNVAALYMDMAKLHDENEKNYLDSAVLIATEAINETKKLQLISYMKLATFTKSKALWALKDFEAAKNEVLELIRLQTKDLQLNFSFISESEKEMYFEKFGEDFMYFNSFCLDVINQYPELSIDVYNNCIRNKGMLLKSSTAMKNAILNSNDSALIEDYNDWVNDKKLIAKLYTMMEEKRRNNLDSLEIVANQKERKLVQKSDEFASFTGAQSLDFQTVKKGLDKDEAAVEFIKFYLYDGKNRYSYIDSVIYCALIITPDAKYPEMIPLFSENKIIQLLGGKSSANTFNAISDIYGHKKKLNTKLYQMIWEPLEKHVSSYKNITISPVGYLHKVSFSAIGVDQHIYLSDLHNIRLSPNTGQATRKNNYGTPFDHFTLFGGIQYDQGSEDQVWSYLEGTKKEAEAICSILEKKNKDFSFYSSSNASESQFKEIASKSNVLHVATHGFFFPNPDEVATEIEKESFVGDVAFRGGSRGFGVKKFVKNPNPLMRSGIVFANANAVWSDDKSSLENDGVLTAQEVAHIDLRSTSLVVLSACETALGDIKGSEGVYGLQRAFKMAGVNQLIMSLWKVPDSETAEFMVLFYKNLLKYNDTQIAFNKTQSVLRKKYDPYFWAAFVLLN